MALLLFKSKELIVGPARAALNTHLAVLNDINDQRAKLSERIISVNRDVQDAEDINARIAAVQSTIDAAIADAAYHRTPEPPLTNERKQLAELEQRLKFASKLARRGTTILPRLRADSESLLAQRDGMKSTTDRLLWDACVEEGTRRRDEYLTAIDNVRAAAHKTFAAFTAADTIAKARGFGIFYGSGLYADMYLPLPLHPAYTNPSLTPEAAQQIRQADIGAVHTDAEAFINQLLSGEG